MGVVVDSFAGSVRVEFDHEAAFTPLGQLPFFIDFLKTAGLFEAFVADCPLRYTSPNAPKKRRAALRSFGFTPSRRQARPQPLLLRRIAIPIRDRIQEFDGIGQESAQAADDKGFEIGRWDPLTA